MKRTPVTPINPSAQASASILRAVDLNMTASERKTSLVLHYSFILKVLVAICKCVDAHWRVMLTSKQSWRSLLQYEVFVAYLSDF